MSPEYRIEILSTFHLFIYSILDACILCLACVSVPVRVCVCVCYEMIHISCVTATYLPATMCSKYIVTTVAVHATPTQYLLVSFFWLYKMHTHTHCALRIYKYAVAAKFSILLKFCMHCIRLMFLAIIVY